jgi:hypothetical protein
MKDLLKLLTLVFFMLVMIGVAALFMLIFSSCDTGPRYQHATEIMLVDSISKEKTADLIKDGLAKTSYKLYTTKYKKPWVLVRELEKIGINLWGKEVNGLNFIKCDECWPPTFIPYKSLSEKEKFIFEYLSKHGDGEYRSLKYLEGKIPLN